MGKVLVIDLDYLQRLLQLPDRLQGRARRQRLVADRQAAARHGAVLEQGARQRARPVPKVKVTYQHSICQHCDDAPCIQACNVEAIYKRDDGAVIIDPDKCRGNQLCLSACPYRERHLLQRFAEHRPEVHLLRASSRRRLDRARASDACPTGAFTFGEEEELKELIARAEPLGPASTSSRASTTSACPSSSSPARCSTREPTSAPSGATVTATNVATGATAKATTDSYGDFWLNEPRSPASTRCSSRRQAT